MTKGYVTISKNLVSILKAFLESKQDNTMVEITDDEVRILWEKIAKDVEFTISADFITEQGFGGIRYYQQILSYYNKDLHQWIELTVTPENKLIVLMGMTPQPMQSIACIYDCNKNHYKLKWKESADTVIDGQSVCMIEKVIIRRKLGSAPLNENDGSHVITIPRSMFGMHYRKWWVDESFTPNMGDVWYYKAFPVSTFNQINYTDENDTGGVLAKDYELYGIAIRPNDESNCGSIIRYIEDNKNFTPAHMDYNKDEFDYGDFTPGDICFMNIFQCMLNNDGTIHKKINPNNYDLYEDGTPSDISNKDFNGDAMIARPKIYMSFKFNEDGEFEIRYSNKKLDDTFVCWKWLDKNGNEIPYAFDPLYKGTVINGKNRSLSGFMPTVNTTRQQEVNYNIAKNSEGNDIWYTKAFNDFITDVMLLWLIGKSTNTKEVFGHGNNSSYVSASNTGVLKSGTMNQKGLFYGKLDNVSGVKVFGIEHLWGNIWDGMAGWILDHGKQKIKLTQSTIDGSTVDNYNFDGNGYIEIPNSTPSGSKGGFINKILFNDKFGFVPIITNGSATTYYSDGFWFNNSILAYPLVGGPANVTLRVGALCAGLNNVSSFSGWGIGSSTYCKPLAV